MRQESKREGRKRGRKEKQRGCWWERDGKGEAGKGDGERED